MPRQAWRDLLRLRSGEEGVAFDQDQSLGIPDNSIFGAH